MSPSSCPLPVTALHAGLTKEILRAFYHTHNTLGAGLPEPICSRSLLISLRSGGMSCTTEVRIPVYFEGRPVGSFRIDVVVESLVIVELKAKSRIEPINESQILNYLHNTKYEVGLLLNFGPTPEVRRFVFTNDRKSSWQRSPAGLLIQDHSLDAVEP